MSDLLEWGAGGELIGERLVRGQGRWRRLVCRWRGHDIEITEQQRLSCPEPEHRPPPEPRPGVVFIEQRQIYHWISAIEIQHLRCNRCHGEWRREADTEYGPSIRRSAWMWLEVGGRVIPPPESEEV